MRDVVEMHEEGTSRIAYSVFDVHVTRTAPVSFVRAIRPCMGVLGLSIYGRTFKDVCVSLGQPRERKAKRREVKERRGSGDTARDI